MAALTEDRLFAEAGDLSFERGQDYVRYVVGLRVEGQRAQASIQARNVYQVELDWSRRDLRCSCTCPHFEKGFFCKHLVAVGLAAIDAGHGATSGPINERPPLAELVASLDEAELRGLVADLADHDPNVRRTLERRVAAKTGDVTVLAVELEGKVKQGLSFRGPIDYRRSFDAASQAESLLDELETYLDDGAADAVRPALLRATTRLRKLVLQADDSSGLLGGAGQRAAELYARACREGAPDATAVARWLVRFRDSSPGWPQLELADFVEAFDEPALEVYRREVRMLDEKYADRDWSGRFDVRHMLLELADHDGDVDRAIEILSTAEHPSYGAIVERLRAAGRDDEVIEWIDRAVAAGRVSGFAAGGGDYWLDPAAVALTYRDLGRTDDAIDVLRSEFVRRPELATFKGLLEFATACGRRETERSWALGQLLERATGSFGTGALLVEIALDEGDLETAWSAARDLGAGHQWRALADASRDFAPLEAAALYQQDVEKDLRVADSKRYDDIARRLVTMRDLFARADADDEFAAYLAQLRETYRRRTSLIAALGRRGL